MSSYEFVPASYDPDAQPVTHDGSPNLGIEAVDPFGVRKLRGANAYEQWQGCSPNDQHNSDCHGPWVAPARITHFCGLLRDKRPRQMSELVSPGNGQGTRTTTTTVGSLTKLEAEL